MSSDLPPGFSPCVTVSLADIKKQTDRIIDLVRANNTLAAEKRLFSRRSRALWDLISFSTQLAIPPAAMKEEASRIMRAELEELNQPTLQIRWTSMADAGK